MQSKATTVDEYLAGLPADRRPVVATVRDLVRRHTPPGYAESVAWGMICWSVPLARYPNTYNGQPLAYVSLAAQKNHYALYLTCAYQESEESRWLADAFRRAGKKMDMGKSCLRFKSLDDLPLEAIGEFISRTPVDEFIRQYEEARAAAGVKPTKPRAAARPSGTKTATKKTAPRKAAAKSAPGTATKKAASKKSARR